MERVTHFYRPAEGHGLLHDPFNSIVGFSSIGHKDTVANLEVTGEFVWNLVSRDLAEAMNETSTMDRVDEWERAGLEAAASVVVAPPRVAAAPVSFECKVTQIVRLADQDGGEVDAWMTFGEVVGVHIDEQFLVDGIYDTALARPLLRAGGPSAYYEVGERLDLRRPR